MIITPEIVALGFVVNALQTYTQKQRHDIFTHQRNLELHIMRAAEEQWTNEEINLSRVLSRLTKTDRK